MDEEMKNFMLEMRTSMGNLPTKDQFSDLTRTIRDNTSGIRNNSNRLDDQEATLKTIQTSIARIEQEQVQARRGLAGKIDQALQGRPALPETRMMDDQEFERARKSARRWPIDGTDGQALEDNVMEFLRGALGLQAEDIGKFTVSRPEKSRTNLAASAVHSEVVVEFRDKFVRDQVMACGPKLAGYVDRDKRPTCGMRLEIPKHLAPSFSILNRYGASLKKKAGTQVKKHIKFDNFGKCMFIQVKVDGDGEWMNVSVDEARASNTRSDMKKNQRLRQILSPERGEKGNASRSMSESDANTIQVQEVPQDPVPTWKPTPRLPNT